MPTFYVDTIKTYQPSQIRGAQTRRAGRDWCHLWTDGELEDLHRFAARLGMKREWFQHHRLVPHYDLVPSRRAKALELGAVEMSMHEWMRKTLYPRTGGPVEKEPGEMSVIQAQQHFLPHEIVGKLDGRELMFGGARHAGRANEARVRDVMGALANAQPALLPVWLLDLLPAVCRFVEKHGPMVASGEKFKEHQRSVKLDHTEELDPETATHLERAAADVATRTLARILPVQANVQAAAFYLPGDGAFDPENGKRPWELWVWLYDPRRWTPKRPPESAKATVRENFPTPDHRAEYLAWKPRVLPGFDPAANMRRAAVKWCAAISNFQVVLAGADDVDKMFREHVTGATGFTALLMGPPSIPGVKILYTFATIMFPNNSQILFRSCRDMSDIQSFAGMHIHALLVDGDLDSRVFSFLRARCRVGSEITVPPQYQNSFPAMLSSGKGEA